MQGFSPLTFRISPTLHLGKSHSIHNDEIGGKCPSILDNLAEKVVDSDIDFWYDKVQVEADL